MLWLIIIAIAIAIAAAVLLRPRQTVPNRPVAPQADTGFSNGMGGAGKLLTGMMLSYLVSNFLIDSHQYETWRGLTSDELKTALGDAGIMTGAEFDGFSQQLVAEAQVHEAHGEYGSQDMHQGYVETGNAEGVGGGFSDGDS